MESKIFWIVVAVLGLLAVIVLPLWWAVAATAPIVLVAAWIGYQSTRPHRHILTHEQPPAPQRDTTDKHAA
jgi:hypothetical protein